MKIVGQWFVQCHKFGFLGFTAPAGRYDMGQITERVEDVLHDDYYAVEFTSESDAPAFKRIFASSVIAETFVLFDTYEQASTHMKWLLEMEEERRPKTGTVPEEEIN